MEPAPRVSSVSRGTDHVGSTSSSLMSKALPPPCTAALYSLQHSLLSGLTTASVASVDTSTTLDSTMSRGAKVPTGAETSLIWAVEGTTLPVEAALENAAPTTQVPVLSAAAVASVAAVRSDTEGLSSFPPSPIGPVVPPTMSHGDDSTPLSPLATGTSHLCCGPPPLLPRDEAHRASTAATFLQRDLSPLEGDTAAVEEVRMFSPEEEAGLPCWSGRRPSIDTALLDAALSDAAATEGVASPLVAVTVSPTTGSTTTTHHRSRSFTTQLPSASTFVSADDLARSSRPAEVRESKRSTHKRCLCLADRAQGETNTTPLQQRRSAFPPTRADHSDSHVTLSTLTTPVTPQPSAARGAEETAAAAVGLPSHRNRVSPRSVSEGGSGVSPASPAAVLTRVTSLDTVATISSSRSRPALTPAATGLPGNAPSTVGSTTASTTVTSVTYTRKNVSLGALDFYGNPVTSLSTLLAQMSVRSGDREEFDNLDLRYTSQQQQQQSHQERNTLSMQNLKAHTQQVGVMGPEDKIKRLRGRTDTVLPSASMLRRRRASCPAAGLLNASATAAGGAAARPQVGNLKDVLQECNFLCINDVISAIAETQVHELREAQQQLNAAAVAATATTTDSVAGDGETSSDAATRSPSKALPPPPPPSYPLPLQQQQQQSSNQPTAALSAVPSSPLLRLPPVDSASSGFITASPGQGSCVSGLHVSADALDPQHALSLAAAMTEVSLNLERGSEVSSSISHLVTGSGGGCTSRSHFLRAASGRTVTGSVCDATATTPSVTSGSLPNMLAEVPVAVSHTSTVATPVLLGRTASCSFHVPPSTAEVTPVSTTVTAVGFPDDPLEHKVLRSDSSSDVVTAACAGDREATVNERRCGVRRKSRCVPNWHGICASGEEQMNEVRGPDLDIEYGTADNASPLRAPLPRRQDDDDRLARSIVCDLSEVYDCAAMVTGGSSQEPTGASNSATEVRVVIDCMACTSFDDELTTVRELRKWARCVAQQEQLQPSTETEVTT